MDRFSATLDKAHYDNAIKIFQHLKENGYNGNPPHVTTREKYKMDAFKFEEAKDHKTIEDALGDIEHF